MLGIKKLLRSRLIVQVDEKGIKCFSILGLFPELPKIQQIP
jgi:hypothetical protein